MLAMMFRRRPRAEPLNLSGFDPGKTPYPFAFPVVVVAADGTVVAHRSALPFGLPDQGAAWSGEVPAIEVFAACSRDWRPLRIVAATSTGKVLFGRPLVPEVRTRPVVSGIEADAGDLWTQNAPREELLGAIRSAATFTSLAESIVVLGGHGVSAGGAARATFTSGPVRTGVSCARCPDRPASASPSSRSRPLERRPGPGWSRARPRP